MTDKPVGWWRGWMCDPAPLSDGTITAPPVFAKRYDNKPPFGATVGFCTRYLNNGEFSLYYWPQTDKLVLTKVRAHIAERTMPDTKEELIAWCRMVIELS